MTTFLARLIREDSGQDIVEYALLFILLALAALGGLTSLGSGLSQHFAYVSSLLSSG